MMDFLTVPPPHEGLSVSLATGQRTGWWLSRWDNHMLHGGWFERQYQHRLSQSTVSEILSAKYKHLDQENPSWATSLFRQRSANWPILESILSDWERSISQQGGFLNSQILIEKARQIWPQIPQYQHLPTPEFSVGWLANFKKRHHC